MPAEFFSDRNLQEWDKLAKWVVNHKLFSHNVRWLIQVPRLYEVYKGTGAIKNFGELVRSRSSVIFSQSFSLNHIVLQTCSSRCSRSHRTPLATQNSTSSSSGLSDSIVSMMSPRRKDGCSESSRWRPSGILPRVLLTRTGT